MSVYSEFSIVEFSGACLAILYYSILQLVVQYVFSLLRPVEVGEVSFGKGMSLTVLKLYHQNAVNPLAAPTCIWKTEATYQDIHHGINTPVWIHDSGTFGTRADEHEVLIPFKLSFETIVITQGPEGPVPISFEDLLKKLPMKDSNALTVWGHEYEY